MNIGRYTFQEFLDRATEFHGYPAPGLVIGAFMVELAKGHLPEGTLFEALVETPKCLPDAVQLLTLCSAGNGRMKVVNWGLYALSLYDKYTGDGVRVFLDPARLDRWPEIKTWCFKLKPKREQQTDLLLDEIRRAGSTIFGVKPIKVSRKLLDRRDRGSIAICPVCREAYPSRDGSICRKCQGEGRYLEGDGDFELYEGPELVAVPLQEAVGKSALHDMTRIVPGRHKGAAVTAGQEIKGGDLCRLQQMGRSRVYVLEGNEPSEEWLHENHAVRGFAEAMAGEGVRYSLPPKEGKITFTAARQGLFVVEPGMLERFNMVPNVMCASRQSYSVVEEGKQIAGCRAIPLYLSRRDYGRALRALENGSLFRVLPMREAMVGILVTGTEVFTGLVEDKFIPIIRSKAERLSCRVVASDIVPDDRKAISKSVAALIDGGVDLIVTTAGLSVDPDDVTLRGLLDAGATDILYGAPILPGAMTMLARIGEVQVIGVPACALFYKTTSFDLLFPRLLAGVDITRRDLARIAEGGFCLNCRSCTYPKCPFGK